MQSGTNDIVIFLIVTTFLIVLLMGIIVSILYLYQKKQITFHDQLINAQLEIQEETFQNISIEIHDNIGLSLTLAKLHLNTISLNCHNKSSSNIMTSIELISQAINDLSDISKNLNSDAIRNEGFINALKMRLEKIRKLKKFNLKLEVIGQPIFMDSQNELILYRITQEALNNIIKHSKATAIEIELNYENTCFTLKIADNGIGFNLEKAEKERSVKLSAGLNNMKKRAKMLNGSCHIKSDTLGTTILVNIPLEIQ